MKTNNILRPKGSHEIVKDLIKNGDIGEKYSILCQLFIENLDEIFDEMMERGIGKEEFVDSYISQWGNFRKESNEEKVHWVLNDILLDHLDEISQEMVNNALNNQHYNSEDDENSEDDNNWLDI